MVNKRSKVAKVWFSRSTFHKGAKKIIIQGETSFNVGPKRWIWLKFTVSSLSSTLFWIAKYVPMVTISRYFCWTVFSNPKILHGACNHLSQIGVTKTMRLFQAVIFFYYIWVKMPRKNNGLFDVLFSQCLWLKCAILCLPGSLEFDCSWTAPQCESPHVISLAKSKYLHILGIFFCDKF